MPPPPTDVPPPTEHATPHWHATTPHEICHPPTDVPPPPMNMPTPHWHATLHWRASAWWWLGSGVSWPLGPNLWFSSSSFFLWLQNSFHFTSFLSTKISTFDFFTHQGLMDLFKPFVICLGVGSFSGILNREKHTCGTWKPWRKRSLKAVVIVTILQWGTHKKMNISQLSCSSLPSFW